MFKIGDYVTRKKYNNDIIFKIERIDNNKIILRGVDLRLYADAEYSDLVLTSISKKKQINSCIRNLDTNKYFYIPGTILHIDSDKDYLDKCMEYYDNQRIKCIGYKYSEKDYRKNIEKLISIHNPNILVITGHDAYYEKSNKYKNSKFFIESVKLVRNIKSFDELIIIAGACQSDFEGLIKSGATYASSPSHINIHALDPAIIASYLALSDKDSPIDLEDILSKTNYGKDGIGGIKTNGTMLCGYPRKEKN